jgi:Bacterial DNA-binding protein
MSVSGSKTAISESGPVRRRWVGEHGDATSLRLLEGLQHQNAYPRTGETITIAAKRDARFKPGKELTEKLAQGETAPTPEVAPPPAE